MVSCAALPDPSGLLHAGAGNLGDQGDGVQSPEPGTKQEHTLKPAELLPVMSSPRHRAIDPLDHFFLGGRSQGSGPRGNWQLVGWARTEAMELAPCTFHSGHSQLSLLAHWLKWEMATKHGGFLCVSASSLCHLCLPSGKTSPRVHTRKVLSPYRDSSRIGQNPPTLLLPLLGHCCPVLV